MKRFCLALLLVAGCSSFDKTTQKLNDASDSVVVFSHKATNTLEHVSSAFKSMEQSFKEVTPSLPPLLDSLKTTSDSANQLMLVSSDAIQENNKRIQKIEEEVHLILKDYREAKEKTRPYKEESWKAFSTILTLLAGSVLPILIYGLKRYLFGSQSIPSDIKKWLDTQKEKEKQKP